MLSDVDVIEQGVLRRSQLFTGLFNKKISPSKGNEPITFYCGASCCEERACVCSTFVEQVFKRSRLQLTALRIREMLNEGFEHVRSNFARLLSTALAYSRLLSPTLDCSRLLSTALAYSRLLSPTLDCSRLLSTALAYSRLLSPTLDCSRLLSTALAHWVSECFRFLLNIRNRALSSEKSRASKGLSFN